MGNRNGQKSPQDSWKPQATDEAIGGGGSGDVFTTIGPKHQYYIIVCTLYYTMLDDVYSLIILYVPLLRIICLLTTICYIIVYYIASYSIMLLHYMQLTAQAAPAPAARSPRPRGAGRDGGDPGALHIQMYDR